MKQYLKYFSTLIFGCMVATYCCASQESAQKKEYTFFITISEKDNPAKTGSNSLMDEIDKFSSSILGLGWPDNNNEKLWRIKEVERKKSGDKRYIGPMSISDFSNTIKINPYYNRTLEKSFSFPHALSDDKVKKLVENKNITYQVETGTRINLILENDQKSLQKLGLVQKKQDTPPSKVNIVVPHHTESLQEPDPVKNLQDAPHSKVRHPILLYAFGSLAGLSIIAYLLKTLS